MKAARVQWLKRREVSAEDPTKSSWIPGKSVRVIFPADELQQKFLSLGDYICFGSTFPSGSMFHRPSTAPSVKSEVVIPPSSTEVRTEMAIQHENWTAKYAALPNGGGACYVIPPKL